MSEPLSRGELKIRQRLKDDFPHYADKCLKIRTKGSGIKPFTMNDSQWFVHHRLAKQLEDRGRVRALILKGRQWGCSTLVEGRYYWKTTHQPGIRAFILTHEQDATDNLFGMAERFHVNCPALVKPHTGAANAKELSFDLLDSGYRVGTAGGKPVGHSQTIQLFHGSEVARWANAAEHMTGVLNAVPDADGTEIILESVAAGASGMFYEMAKKAERGGSEFELIFVPWSTHKEYRATPPKDWKAPPAFAEYGELHKLEPEQVYWAWRKNAELAEAHGQESDEIFWKFREQYPATSDEAFQFGNENAFIPSHLILRARKFEAPGQSHTPLIFGCDFARNAGQGDRNWFLDRQGRAMGRKLNDAFYSEDTVEIADRLAGHIDKLSPDMCFLDSGGGGSAVYDILKDRRYGDRLSLVNFGGKANDARKYANKRAEMWGDMRDWLADPGGADMPDDDALAGDINAPEWRENANSQILLEAKDKIRERLHLSPDGGDAAALTFGGRVMSLESRHHQDQLIQDHYRKMERAIV